MTGTTLERERIKTANPPHTQGPPGAHPVGTGLGAAAGGAAEGGLAGTVAGNKIARAIDPTAEEAYWRENYSSRPYVTRGAAFNEYRPAYRYGIDSFTRRDGRSFEQAEPALSRDWNRVKGISSLTWENARHATRDAWQHASDFVERATPGDSDHDGK